MKRFLSLLLCVTLLATMAAMPALAESLYTAGTYTAAARGNNGDVTVEVTFSDSAITEVVVTAHEETPGLSDPAISGIPEAIKAQQSLAVDTVSGATNTSKAILAAVEDCVKQAGADPEALKVVTEAEVSAKTEEEQTSDVLVVGGGIAGLTAAMSAAENGASVILIDKMPAVGGTTALAGGYLICVDSQLYDGEHLDFDSVESMLAYWEGRMAYSGVENEYPDWERLEGVIAETGATVDWLGENGVPWGESCFVYFGGYPAAACDGLGANLVAKLLEACQAKGVTVLTGCKAEKLLTEGDAVVGAVAETDSSVITFHAKSVVLATGGISQNEELVAQYSPKVAQAGVIPTSAVSNTGDGLLMALEVGAGTFDTFATAINNICVDPALTAAVADASALQAVAQLGVNAKGERFTNEAAGASFGTYDQTASDMIQDGNAPFWFLYDAANEDVTAILEAGVAAGIVAKGETIADLAAAMNVDAAALAATYARYSELVAAGEDSDFGKDASMLVAIEKAPFYAVKFYPTTFGSVGGVMTTDQGRVQKADGAVIPGLYAAGEMSNRYYYNENYILAASLGLYSTMGRRAGAAAAADALQ